MWRTIPWKNRYTELRLKFQIHLPENILQKLKYYVGPFFLKRIEHGWLEFSKVPRFDSSLISSKTHGLAKWIILSILKHKHENWRDHARSKIFPLVFRFINYFYFCKKSFQKSLSFEIKFCPFGLSSDRSMKSCWNKNYSRASNNRSMSRLHSRLNHFRIVTIQVLYVCESQSFFFRSLISLIH